MNRFTELDKFGVKGVIILTLLLRIEDPNNTVNLPFRLFTDFATNFRTGYNRRE